MATKVLASRYNALRSRINQILGDPANLSDTDGYAQSLRSSDVVGDYFSNPVTVDKIEASQLLNLYIDIARARIHQVESGFVIGNDVILEAGVDKVVETYISNLESVMTLVEADRDLVAPSQILLENLEDGTGAAITRTRTSQWRGVLNHEFLVNFSSEAEMRGFFNARGEIRLDPTLTGGSGLKTGDWRNLLGRVGVITYSTDGVSSTGSPTLNNTLLENLTTTYTEIVRENGVNYLNNSYRLSVKRQGTNALSFLIQYRDDDNPPGFGVDEFVNGTLTSDVKIYRPNGSFSLGGTSYSTVSFAVTGLVLQSP